MKETKAITLIALVITIIVLLILAGVALATLTGQGNILVNAENAVGEYNNSVIYEQQILNELEKYFENNGHIYEDWDEKQGVNKPKTVEGMIPVYYENGVWKKADTTNEDETKKWYSYTEENKQWANVVTVESSNLSKYSNAEIGTEIAQSEITAMFVWIPRYSYEIKGEKNIEISFLKGTSNKEANGEETAKIVHPVFTDGSKNNYAEGGWDRELTGYWVAKFEASGVENGNFVGNGSSTQNSSTQEATPSTYVKILPNVISWRYITIGDAQYRCMQMAKNTEAYGWNEGSVDSHLIKNDEWGAVAYLCYSKYGNVPMTNGAGEYNSTGEYWYNLYTGAGPYTNDSENGTYAYTETHAYNTENGVLASTTGNVYGVYDMAGGAWERVAGYLNNGNEYLGTYGKTTTLATSEELVYFEKKTDNENISYDSYNGWELKEEYKKYWNRYEVGEEEKSNQIKINDSTTLTQHNLWNESLTGEEYNAARLRITTETYNKMANVRGIGVNEVASSFSYYGAYNNGTINRFDWFTDTEQPGNKVVTYGRAWDSDLVLIGHACVPFVDRGGHCNNRASAGVLYSHFTYGYASYNAGFRPVVVPST